MLGFVKDGRRELRSVLETDQPVFTGYTHKPWKQIYLHSNVRTSKGSAEMYSRPFLVPYNPLIIVPLMVR